MDVKENKSQITSQLMLDAIMRTMQSHTFSKEEASSIVGGEARLKRLISEGKISVEKPSKKWFCNAADVLRCIKIQK